MDPGAELELLLRGAVTSGVSSAASAWIWHDGRVVACAATGVTRADSGQPVCPDTLFDVASLTKPLAAAVAARLVAASLADPEEVVVSDPQATLTQVLSHRAGFEAWRPIHELVDGRLVGTEQARRAVIREAGLIPRKQPDTRTEYSDLGFICLAHWLEQRCKKGLVQALLDDVTGPLGLVHTHYRPHGRTGDVPDEAVAATEIVSRRGGLIQGAVHDDNAFAMGGVSAHAGLFSTASDMGRFAVATLEACEKGGWLERSVARWFARPVAKGCRTPGWDVKSPEGSSAGNSFGTNSFGHLGFTGCSLWVDPEERLVACLLTNRIHPTSTNEAIRTFRPLFHDRVHELALESP